MFKNNLNSKFILLIGILILILLTINTIYLYSIFNLEKKQLDNSFKIAAIKQEEFLGDLLFQYYAELDICVNNSELTEEQCKEELLKSTLVEKITQWGGAEYIKN